MTQRYLEWDFDNPKHKQRRRRQPLPLEGEVLGPELEVEPASSRIQVEIVHYHRRQRQHVPPWAIAILIIGALAWVSPIGLVIALFMVGVFVTAYPTVAIALGIFLVLFIGIAVRERLAGRSF